MAAVRMRPWVLTALVLNLFISFVSSLFFHMKETEHKCFIEDIPDQTLLLGNFWTYPADSEDLGIFLEAKDPDGQLVLAKQYSSQGGFRFTSQKPGGHQICLHPTTWRRPLSAAAQLTVHLHVRTGESTNNYTEIASVEKLSELRLRIRQLTEQVRQIQKELDYQRVREIDFREISNNTNMWIFWWPVVRSLYVIAIITWTTNSW